MSRPTRFSLDVNRYLKSVLLYCLLALLPLAFHGGTCQAAEAPADKPLLTLDRIFSSEEFEGEKAPAILWRKLGSTYTTLDKAGEKGEARQLVWHDPAASRTEVLVPSNLLIPPGESAPLSVESYSFSDDGSKLLIYTNSKRVWRLNSRGDYWVLDIAGRVLKKLGGDAKPSSLMFAEFSPDGTRVGYVRENNLYVQNLNDLRITALTRNGSETLINGTFDWVYEEELRLRKGFRWSPDSRTIAYWQINTQGVPTFYLINDTDGLYPRLIPIRYPKVGQTNPAARVGVVSADGGETRWLDAPGDPRDHYLARMDWAETFDEIVLQQFNRLQNTNRVMLADAKTGSVRTILTETDSAWVENNNDVRWVAKGKKFVWLSERDGWRHAYLVSRSGEDVSLITKGAFDVISIESIDEKNGWLYYIASPDNPTQRYLYRVRVDGREAKRVTPADRPGSHGYSISPDAKWAIHTYSTFDRPPVVELISLPDHKQVRVLAENKKLMEKLNTLKKPSSEFFRLDIGDNVLLDGWCIKPPDFDPKRKYPVLFHVYGEPEGQTVVDRWPARAHLWHWMLAQQGYLIVSLDNRGTAAPRGRDWRKCVYRQIGILASADQAAAARALIKKWPYVDASRIAVWGWSGGGSMTLNALFRYPDLYHTGMAVAPVPNERYYDTIYEERYMGLPGDNADGYRRGSPITYAHQLKGNLLLVHGTGDDNCHYQGMEALINELIAHNKPFTMMAYPNRTHSISEGKNTTRHLYELLTRFLNEKMPASLKQKYY
jgi:dipeptidyl-peptidase-4